jgi:DNA polymerase elongation subunit (family B)
MNPFPRLDINELSDNTKPIVYQITDWFIPETDKNKGDYESDDNYTIYIYGTTEDNITVCTKVVNFKPFFYVKPPAKWQDLNEKDLKQKVKDFQSKVMIVNLKEVKHLKKKLLVMIIKVIFIKLN